MNIVYVLEIDPDNGVIGKLSQGGFQDVISVSHARNGVDHLILAACDFQEEDRMFHCDVSRVPLWDMTEFPLSEYIETKRVVISTAKEAASLIRQGRHVLSTCWAGLNRSGLITAVTLMELGFNAEDSVEIVRKSVGVHGLCNDLFVEMIKEIYVEQNYNSRSRD